MGNGEKSDPHSSKNELHVVSANVSVQPLYDLCRGDCDIGRGRDLSITMSVPKKRGFWPALMNALHSHDIDVTSATLCTNHHTDFHSINCKVNLSIFT
jgi:hypothetical protein